MGKYKKEKDAENQEFKKIDGKKFLGCLLPFLASMVGGLILGWWEYEHHPTNTQLWMVPFGLILFATPLIVWFALSVSDICNTSMDMENSKASELVGSMGDSVGDVKQQLKEVIVM